MWAMDSPRAASAEQCEALIAQGLFLQPDATLETAMPMFDKSGEAFILVLAPLAPGGQEGQLMGAVFHVDALRAYNRSWPQLLLKNIPDHQMRGMCWFRPVRPSPGTCRKPAGWQYPRQHRLGPHSSRPSPAGGHFCLNAVIAAPPLWGQVVWCRTGREAIAMSARENR